jgi:hypothetical protein
MGCWNPYKTWVLKFAFAIVSYYISLLETPKVTLDCRTRVTFCLTRLCRVCGTSAVYLWHICRISVTHLWHICNASVIVCDQFLTHVGQIFDIFVAQLDISVTHLWHIYDMSALHPRHVCHTSVTYRFVTYLSDLCDRCLTFCMWHIWDVSVTHLWYLWPIIVAAKSATHPWHVCDQAVAHLWHVGDIVCPPIASLPRCLSPRKRRLHINAF